jgi:ParB/RepB/Spo0J family partition protein
MGRNLTRAELHLMGLGITEPKEIDVRAIAYDAGAAVRVRKLTRCEARIVGVGDKAIISISEDSGFQRRRFSVAHELGHWALHRGRQFECRSTDIENAANDPLKPERQADDYAADLLMPWYLFMPLLGHVKHVDLALLEHMQRSFDVSLPATAIRIAEANVEPVIVACYDQTGRRWFSRSKDVRERLTGVRHGVTDMATAVQKITLSSSRDIPFNKLVLSQSNVRRVKAGISVEELAESIARRGLIQSLHVRPVVDAEGKETGMFEVPAGGRRFRALELLVKQKRLAKIAPVPCVVSEASADVLIDEVSLAENIERAPLHPLDQFRAFQAMREKGMTEEAIAAAFFVDSKVVKQRLRLVSVSPALLDVYAEDGMTLEQLMAFSVSSDHARQEQVWEAIRDGWQKEPYHIRRLLTETTVRAADKRAVFVGIAMPMKRLAAACCAISSSRTMVAGCKIRCCSTGWWAKS